MNSKFHPNMVSGIYHCPENPIPQNVQSHIEAVSVSMIHHAGHSKSDYEDICQELSLAVIKAYDRYNCTRSSYYTFAQKIIHDAKCNIYRLRIRKNHDAFCSTLDSLENDNPFLIDMNMQPPDITLNTKDVAELIQSVLSELDPMQKKICVLIMNKTPMRKIIASCSLSPSQFYHRIWPELRSKFKKKMRKPKKTTHTF